MTSENKEAKKPRRRHSKPDKTTVLVYAFRVELRPSEVAEVHQKLDLGWELRNSLAQVLDDDRRAQREVKKAGGEPDYLSKDDIQSSVAGTKLPSKFSALHSQVRQNIAHRVIEGTDRWFDALKKGNTKVKPPRPIKRKNFRSLTYPQYGTAANIKGGKLHLAKIGDFKVTGWRKMRGKKKTVTLKWKDGHFWVYVTCEMQEKDQIRAYKEVKGTLPEVGIDPGIAVVMTDSHNMQFETPKPLKKAQKILRRRGQDVSRKLEARKSQHAEARKVAKAAGQGVPPLRLVPYSKRLKGAISKLGQAHTKVARIREDAIRKNARKVERTDARVAVEEHSIKFMQANRKTAKASADVAIGKQKLVLRQVLGKGRYHEASNRRAGIGGNSQTCLCGHAVPKTLSNRWHSCENCGLQGPRDQVSAIICQFETFGTIPDAVTAGLAGLEHSIIMLKQGRGEDKGGLNESSAVELARASEPSTKRQAPRRSRQEKPQAENQVRKSKPVVLEANASSSPPETKDPTGSTPDVNLLVVASGLAVRSPRLQAGE